MLNQAETQALQTVLARPAKRTAKLHRMAHSFSDFDMLRASGEIRFRFDDLSLEIEGGFSAGAFNGVAKVTYWNDAEEGLHWFVGDILLDCSRWNGKDYDVRTVTVSFGDPLYIQLWTALTDDGTWKDSIDARVREAL